HAPSCARFSSPLTHFSVNGFRRLWRAMTAASSRARNGLLLMEFLLVDPEPNDTRSRLKSSDRSRIATTGALERGDAVPAQALGVGEGTLGGGDQVVGGRRIGREAGDAEARGDRPVREWVRRDDSADALGIRDGAGLGRVREQRREDIAVEPGDD